MKKYAELQKDYEDEYQSAEKNRIDLEIRIEVLTKEGEMYRCELSSKDEYCETLKKKIIKLESELKKTNGGKAIKTLSNIILSKDSSKTDLNTRIKELESEVFQISEEKEKLVLSVAYLHEWRETITDLIKEKKFYAAVAFVEGKDIDFYEDTSFTDKSLISGKDAGVDELQKVIEGLEKKIEYLETKLELQVKKPEYISYMVCQAKVIEDYLKEDMELSQINSSMFSF